MILPVDAQERKNTPIYSGVVKYFPRALAAVAQLSWRGNQQHHPDKPLHWDMSKSTDELDALMRHIIDEDWDAVAWRALAHLERELQARECDGPEGEYDPNDARHPEDVHAYMRQLRRDPNQ